MSNEFALVFPDARIMFHVKRQADEQEGCGQAQQQGTTMFHMKHQPQYSLLLAGGRKPDKIWLQKLAQANNFTVYCADKGVDYALAAQLVPKLVVGDCDSSSPTLYAKAQELGATLELHPPAKDDTDLQLLLAKLPEQDLIATGIWGGRFDHLFSNVYSLLAFKEQRHCQVILADAEELMLLLTSEDVVEVELADVANVQALSLLPLAQNSMVSIEGVRWPLEKAVLNQERPYAISNEIIKKQIKCTCHLGKVGLYIHWQNGQVE